MVPLLRGGPGVETGARWCRAGSAPGKVEFELGADSPVPARLGPRAGGGFLRRGQGSVGWEGFGPRGFQPSPEEGRSQPKVVS